ncbi:type II toxin-antitoxin system VapC family toxin [Brevundimonas sp. R86498]|uniref:type II toxin-antitoxin system VapC family toxin n=1 Tax=Brevundimonas sp. R86498 TaxID=3093845 RepID=UPI0037CAE54E
MKLLLDTQIVLWTAAEPDKLPTAARDFLADPDNDIAFSVVNLWETAIKRALNRPGFQINPRRLRERLIATGFIELAVTGEHALAVEHLPPIHRDPFDRILVAQAMTEGLVLLTSDRLLDGYPGDIRRV